MASRDAPPVKAAPVKAAPVETVPVETVPVETVPVETVPVEAVPVEAVPVGRPGLEASSITVGSRALWVLPSRCRSFSSMYRSFPSQWSGGPMPDRSTAADGAQSAGAGLHGSARGDDGAVSTSSGVASGRIFTLSSRAHVQAAIAARARLRPGGRAGTPERGPGSPPPAAMAGVTVTTRAGTPAARRGSRGPRRRPGDGRFRATRAAHGLAMDRGACYSDARGSCTSLDDVPPARVSQAVTR